MSMLLKVEGLKKSFQARNCTVEVLKNINLTLNRGETTVVSGRSGEGKSTLLALISGLEAVSAGKIWFEDQEITAMSLSQLAELRATSIGLIFQSFNLIANWNAFENVEAVLMHRGISAAVRKEKVEAILARLGLGERMHNLPSELSVGQQQRVAIARTLINNPSLILADEPTGDVDPETAQEIMQLLLPMVKESNAGLLVASHGAFDLTRADRVFRLHDGQLTDASA